MYPAVVAKEQVCLNCGINVTSSCSEGKKYRKDVKSSERTRQFSVIGHGLSFKMISSLKKYNLMFEGVS